ncbi:MAG: bifunctional folylpolyglutamate synthase/dihydrofolate synthase [Lachnospiraceae bacterium]
MMLYKEAENYLDHEAKRGRIPGLERIRCLLQKLGQPQESLTFIQIAGTNGKGSVLSYLSNVLHESGYRTGAFSSPAVSGRRETIQINGAWISEESYADLTMRVRKAAKEVFTEIGQAPSVFEIECAMAFLYFKEKQCDYVVLETGLGGMQDATNIVKNTIACVFTSISLDHQNVLGDSLRAIAEEKAGIIKAGAAVISAPQTAEVKEILQKKARQTGCPWIQVEKNQIRVEQNTLFEQKISYKEYQIELQMPGCYQQENAALAIETIEALQRKQIDISKQAVEAGMRMTQWRGRFSVLSKDPVVIADGAHNPDAAKRLLENLDYYLPEQKRIGIMGVFRDKNSEKMVKMLKDSFSYIYTIDLPNAERTLPKEELRQLWMENEVSAESVDSLQEALKKAYARAQKEKAAVIAFGSLSYLGNLMELMDTGEEKKGR